jgi:hypothetical protein
MHPWLLPAETERAPVNAETVTGPTRVLVEPSPSWPKVFAPQHRTIPVIISAQEWAPPALTARTSERPATETGSFRSVVEPSPSWLSEFSPQHFTVFVDKTAQLYFSPAEIATNASEPVTTSTGDSESVVVPSPNCPDEFDPQQRTIPSRKAAHECDLPTATDATSVKDPTVVGVVRSPDADS